MVDTIEAGIVLTGQR
ncbi:MAG: hypothetical protein ACLTOX_03795 [Streptococcus thermophilus]